MKWNSAPCRSLVPALVTTLMCTPRYEPYSAEVLPVWTCTSVTASAIGRMLVAASRLDDELMPSSDKLFWISRWPAPLKLKPISLLLPPSTPGVVLARLQTLRPLSGSSTIARERIVSETMARSVSMIGDVPATVIVSFNAPTCITALVRATWLVEISTPVALNGRKPASVTVISYVPARTNWMS